MALAWHFELPSHPDQQIRHGAVGEAPADVSCADGSICEHTGEEAHYGLDFRDWAECLGMEVLPVTRERYSDEEIVARCLREMTWYGFDESGKREAFGELERRMSAPDREFVPVEEMLERLGLLDDDEDESASKQSPPDDPDDEP